MDIQKKKRKEWGNEDGPNKRNKFYSWAEDKNFKGGFHDSSITLEDRVHRLERVVEEMARYLSLSSGRRGTMMMGFEGSPGKSYPNYNGLQDYTSKYGRGGENRISYPERYLSSYDMASVARARESRKSDSKRLDSYMHNSQRNGTLSGRRGLVSSSRNDHGDDQVGSRRSWNKGEGPFRLGEGPSAKSVWQASKDEATLEAIRVAGEDNAISRAATGPNIPEVNTKATTDAHSGERAPVWDSLTHAVESLYIDVDSTYAKVLSISDNLLLLKLMERSGPVIDELSGEVATEVLHAVGQISSVQNLSDMAQENKRWQTTVPHDILSIISDLLPLSGFINFRGVCRHWRSAPSCRSNITKLSKKDPWCIFYDFDAQDKDMCFFYQCNDRRSCRVKLPGLRGAKCFVSKHGWLFIQRNNDFLFFNPLTLEEKFLPKYPGSLRSSTCQVGTFSASPTSNECIAIVLSSRDCPTIKIASCRLTANKWVVDTVKIAPHSVPCVSELLPSPKCVFFSVVNNASGPSNRPSNIRPHIIFICYDTHFLFFDIVRTGYHISSLFSDQDIKHFVDCCLKVTNWYSKLKEVHSDDWISTFGKEFTFSFCLFNDCKAIQGDKVLGADYQTILNVPVIKAAWLYKD